MKTKEQNPNGLYLRYIVSKADGTPVDPKAEYFVLRLDSYGKDPKHIKACRKAATTYAEEIKDHLPQLSADLIERYALPDQVETDEVKRIAIEGYTELVKIAERGLSGNMVEVEMFIKQFVNKYPKHPLCKPFWAIIHGDPSPVHLDQVEPDLNQHQIDMIMEISKLNEIAASNLNKYFEQELNRRWPSIATQERLFNNTGTPFQFIAQFRIELLKPEGKTNV